MFAFRRPLNDHQLADAFFVVLGEPEGRRDLGERGAVRDQRREPIRLFGDQLQRVLGLVVGPGGCCKWSAPSPHVRDLEAHDGRRMDSRERHAPAVPCDAEGLVVGVLFGGAVDGAIHAASAGIGYDLRAHVAFRGVENLVRAHVPRHRTTVRHRVDRPDPPRAREFRDAIVSSPIGPVPKTAIVSPAWICAIAASA